jgi:intracellular sulfur oxidation DsrE/DsrF family protein
MNATRMTFDLSRRKCAAFAVGTLTCLALQIGHAQSGAPADRVIFQVSDEDPQKWALALNNVRNVIDALGEDAVQIKIVVYGPAISMLKADSPVGQRVAEVRRQGVRVVACENTMKAFGTGYSALRPNIGYVPAGVIELMRRQREGYACIRP